MQEPCLQFYTETCFTGSIMTTARQWGSCLEVEPRLSSTTQRCMYFILQKVSQWITGTDLLTRAHVLAALFVSAFAPVKYRFIVHRCFHWGQIAPPHFHSARLLSLCLALPHHDTKFRAAALDLLTYDAKIAKEGRQLTLGQKYRTDSG